MTHRFPSRWLRESADEANRRWRIPILDFRTCERGGKSNARFHKKRNGNYVCKSLLPILGHKRPRAGGAERLSGGSQNARPQRGLQGGSPQGEYPAKRFEDDHSGIPDADAFWLWWVGRLHQSER